MGGPTVLGMLSQDNNGFLQVYRDVIQVILSDINVFWIWTLFLNGELDEAMVIELK